MEKLIDVIKWFKDTFPNADLDYPTLDNLRAYPYWSTDITGLVNMLNDAESVEAIPKADYEARLKADMVAMLEEISLIFDEQYYVNRHQLHDDFLNRGLEQGQKIIQQKIDALKMN